jgi:hypothetical protein
MSFSWDRAGGNQVAFASAVAAGMQDTWKAFTAMLRFSSTTLAGGPWLRRYARARFFL